MSRAAFSSALQPGEVASITLTDLRRREASAQKWTPAIGGIEDSAAFGVLPAPHPGRPTELAEPELDIRHRSSFEHYNSPDGSHRPLGAAQGRSVEGHRARAVRGRPRHARHAARRDRAQRRPARHHPRHPLRSRHPLGRVHHRHRRRHPRRKHRRADHRGPAVPRRRPREPRRGADPAARAPRSRAARGGAARRQHRHRAAAARLHDRRIARRDARSSGATTTSSSATSSSAATWTPRWAGADLVVEGEYETGAQEQLYIEPNGMLAVADPAGGVTVWGSMQCPYYVHRALAGLFGLPVREGAHRPDGDGRRIRRQGGVPVDDRRPRRAARVEVGAAREAGLRPRRGHGRDDQAAPVAHAASHRRSRRTDGSSRWTSTSSSTAARTARSRRSCCRAARSTPAGPYFCPNVRIRSRAVATTAPPHGAFRGFGAPQSIFALERHMDRVAGGRRPHARGVPPAQLHSRRAGQRRRAGDPRRQHGRDPRSRAARIRVPRRSASAFAPRTARRSRIKRGIGFSAFMHGAGFTGSGEDHLASVVAVEATAERPRARARREHRDRPGHQHGLQPDRGRCARHPDATRSTWCSPTPPSCRTADRPSRRARRMVVGKLVESAAAGLRHALAGRQAFDYTPDDVRRRVPAYIDRFGPLRASAQYQAGRRHAVGR